MSDVILVKCDCGRHFPINSWKHSDREVIFCPFCHTPHTNKLYDKTWKPNENWHKNKHKSRPFTIGDMRRIFGRFGGKVTS